MFLREQGTKHDSSQARSFSIFNKTAEGLHPALQLAIELEHSTMPPYLYALYSMPRPARCFGRTGWVSKPEE